MQTLESHLADVQVLSDDSAHLNENNVVYFNDVEYFLHTNKAPDNGEVCLALPNYLLRHAVVSGPNGEPVPGDAQILRTLEVGDHICINGILAVVTNVEILPDYLTYLAIFESHLDNLLLNSPASSGEAISFVQALLKDGYDIPSEFGYSDDELNIPPQSQPESQPESEYEPEH